MAGEKLIKWLFRINRDVGFWLAPGVMLGCRRIVSGVLVGCVAEAERDPSDVFDDAVVASVRPLLMPVRMP
jgi:hypothetical protein